MTGIHVLGADYCCTDKALEYTDDLRLHDIRNLSDIDPTTGQLHSPEPPRLLLNQLFTDMESVAGAIGWKQQFRQLEPGPLGAKLRVIGTEYCQLGRISFNRSFHQLGEPPEGRFMVGLPDASVRKIRIAGIDIETALLVNFSSEEALDVISYGPFSGTILAFETGLLARTSRMLNVDPALMDRMRQQRFWTFSEDRLAPLRTLICEIESIATENRDNCLREYQEAFDFELAADVLQLVTQSESQSPDSSSFRRKVLRKAMEALAGERAADLTVGELCEACGASLSTLNRAFTDEFGVTPKVYMRAQRLAGVQQVLVNSERNTQIVDVANSWGFWHMGAFAADYRRQFGELPSETLWRARRVAGEG